MRTRGLSATVMLCAALLLAGCAGEADSTSAYTGGDPERGREAILEYGCASCHATPDLPSVDNGIGPDLDGVADNIYIAGQIPNRPEELIRWIRNPQEMVPGTAMPNLGVTQQDAEDILAYLYDQ